MNTSGLNKPGFWKEKSTWGALALCGLFFILNFVIFGLESDPLRHGDIGTDVRAVIAAREFQKVGMNGLYWTQIEDSGQSIGLKTIYYFRHPSGGVVFLALLLELGFDLATARFLPLLATTIGLFGFYLFFLEATKKKKLALLGLLALGTASPFFLIADSFQLYSYALMAKGLCFWLIAKATFAAGKGYWTAILGAAFWTFVAVILFGLETQPSVGFFSVFFPLIALRSWRGIRRAIAFAMFLGSSMAFGWLVRIWNMMLVFDGDSDRVLGNLKTSFVSRSVRDEPRMAQSDGYFFELMERLVDYLPLHLVLGAVLIASCLLAIRSQRFRNAAPRTAWVVCLSCLLSELIYFLVMRRHVFLHVHTLMHISFAAAAWAACGGYALRKVFNAPWFGITAASVILFVAAWKTPTETRGNLVVNTPTTIMHHDMEMLLDGVSKDAVVVVPKGKYANWTSYYLARQGIDFVSGEARGLDSKTLVKTVVEATDRPILALCGKSNPDVELFKKGPGSPQSGKKLSIFAIANIPFDALPLIEKKLSWQDLDQAILISPTQAEADAGNVNVKLKRRTGEMLYLHAAPPPLSGPTSVDLPIAVDHVGATKVTLDVWYKPVSGMKQAKLNLEVSAVGPTEESVTLAKQSLRMSARDEFFRMTIEMPHAVQVGHLHFSLAMAEGESNYSAARVLCQNIVIHAR